MAKLILSIAALVVIFAVSAQCCRLPGIGLGIGGGCGLLDPCCPPLLEPCCPPPLNIQVTPVIDKLGLFAKLKSKLCNKLCGGGCGLGGLGCGGFGLGGLGCGGLGLGGCGLGGCGLGGGLCNPCLGNLGCL